MANRRDLLTLGILGGTTLIAQSGEALAAVDCDAAASAILDRYVAAVNAHDTGSFPEIFTESYIQHSGRSPSGLPAQIENFSNLFKSIPDFTMHVEDRIIAGDKVVARNTFTATHTNTIFGFPPTGKKFTWRTIDIWRVDSGKFAEHWDLVDVVDVLRKLRNS